MQTQEQKNYATDQIDLGQLLIAVWVKKWIILVVTTICVIAAILYSLKLPDVYRSEVTLAPVQDGGLKMPGQLGGLAALAGVNLGSSGSDKTSKGLEILKSRDFVGRFIESNDLYVAIIAANGWDRNTGKLQIDSSIYDEEKSEWIRNVKYPLKIKPSNLETTEAFQKIFSVEQDKASGMIRISIEHYSPTLAKAWIDKIVVTINEEMRNRELDNAQKSIDYLNNQVSLTNIADVRSMLFSLIEEQTKTLMLANVKKEYIFETIDPAVTAEMKSKPQRALIVIASALISIMLCILVILFMNVNRKR